MPDSATRVVSLHERDARPIVRGRLGKPVEFGYKAQIVDNTDGVILDHTLEQGNPADAPQPAPRPSPASPTGPADHHAQSPPTAATARPASTPTCTPSACRSSRSPAREHPARPDKPSSTDHHFAPCSSGAPAAKGRIAHLKRRSGWDRTLLDGLEGAWT